MAETMLTLRVRLNCLIKGEDIVFPVTVVCDDAVSDLKEFIQNKRALGFLKDIDPHTLELWKVGAIDDPLCAMTLLFLAQGIEPHRRQAKQHSR